MCRRLKREAFGGPLGEKQLMQKHVFDSWTQIPGGVQAPHALGRAAPRLRGAGARRDRRLKVAGARMLHDVIDRAVQVFDAKGLTDDTPLAELHRTARLARISDGPDEVHVQTVGRLLLREYREGRGWDFGVR